MYVSVIYHNDVLHGYVGRSYTYRTELDLKPGDKVLCPVSGEREQKRAMVVGINLDPSEISPVWANKLKTITQWDYTDMNEVRI